MTTTHNTIFISCVTGVTVFVVAFWLSLTPRNAAEELLANVPVLKNEAVAVAETPSAATPTQPLPEPSLLNVSEGEAGQANVNVGPPPQGAEPPQPVNEAPQPVVPKPAPVPQPDPSPQPDPVKLPVDESPPPVQYKSAMTTVFWVGEGAGDDNGYISNAQSAWDEYWQNHYGGVDSPDDRCAYRPCSFTPKENSFYFALPYNDLGKNDVRKASAERIPWFSEFGHRQSVVKNAWIEVAYSGKLCYGQWEDVGPFEEDDFDYVFGAAATPKNTQGERAGLDVSPALSDCLGMTTNVITSWRFIAAADVPAGPWQDVVTTSDVSR